MSTDLIGFGSIMLGAVLILLSAICLVRFPDVLTRIAAVGKSTTAGQILIIIGIAVLRPPGWETFKLVCVSLVLMISTPVVSHLIARAALRNGTPLAPKTQRSDQKR